MKERLIKLTVIGSFGFLVIVLSVVALEFDLNEFAPHFKTWTKGYKIFHKPDEYIGWKGLPDKEGKFRIGRISSYVRINSHGFRDRECTYEKKEGAFRIVVLGDSFTEALQVPLGETFTQVLERRLNSENGKRFEVINLGMSGFGTAQEYLTFKHYGLKYQPDLVMLEFFMGNDVRDNSLTLNNFDRSYRPYFVLNNGKLEEIPFKIKDRNTNKNKGQTERGVRGHLNHLAIRFFPNIYYSLDDMINEKPWLADFLWKIGVKDSVLLDGSNKNEILIIDDYVYTEKYTPEWQDAWEVTKALVLKLAKELKENRIGFLVVVIPDEFEFRPDRWDKILDRNSQMKHLKFDLNKPERILSNFLETNKIDYLLLRPEFEKYSKETGKNLHFHYPYDNHWNTNGHVFAAELIHRRLRNYIIHIIHEVEHKHKCFL